MTILASYRTPQPITCPTCLAFMDGLTHLGGMALPSPGDWTLCAYCHTLLVYLDGGVRRANADEELEAAMDPRMQLYRHALLPRPR